MSAICGAPSPGSGALRVLVVFSQAEEAPQKAIRFGASLRPQARTAEEASLSPETFLCLSAAVALLAFGAVFADLLRDGDGADGGPNDAPRVFLSEDARRLLKVGHLPRMRGARIDEAEADRSAELLYRAFQAQDLDRGLWPPDRSELARAALNVVGCLAVRAADGQEDPERAARLAREINGRLFGDPPYGRFHLLELLGEEIGSWPRGR
jgi:hypothetical protein